MSKYFVFMLTLLLVACGQKDEKKAETAADQQQMADKAAAMFEQTAPTDSTQEPEHIVVQHILIGFAGSVPGKAIKRSQAEAQQLATEILARAQQGEDFAALVREYTDDAFPGKYGMSNNGVQPAANEYPRQGMVPAFGNVGFKLRVDAVGLATYDPRTSPYGWHVIKRVQ